MTTFEKEKKNVVRRVKGRLYDDDLLEVVLDNIDDDLLSETIAWLESDEDLTPKMLKVLEKLSDEFDYRDYRNYM